MLINDLSETIELDGAWGFRLGDHAEWQEIQVPGCWEAQGYSRMIDGPAHYRRKIFIPATWQGRKLFLEFNAVSYACRITLNGVEVGEHRGLWTPFAVDVTAAARPGQPNLVEVEVYKPGEVYPLRSCLAGFLPDVATSFGGLWQPVRLRALQAGLINFQIDTEPDSGQVRVRCQAVGWEAELAGGNWRVDIDHNEQPVSCAWIPASRHGGLDTVLEVAEPACWSPDRPALYTVKLSFWKGGKALAEVSRRVGFRRLAANGQTLLFNGRPICLRGVLSWGWDPQRIAPAFPAEQVRDELRRVRALGFNMVKLCLFVPDQVYFDIADEEGIFLWQEWPMWLPEVSEDLRQQAPQEYAELMQLTRHHPSVVLYSLGCELNQAVDSELLGRLNEAVRSRVSGVLVCDNSGSGESYGGMDFDFSDFSDYHPYDDLHFFEPLLDNWRRDWQAARPWIFGEFCDQDGFRDLEELIAANGNQKPWWMTEENPLHTWRPEAQALLEVRERLAQADLGIPAQQLVQIANQQARVVRKYTLEAVRRRAGMGGYVVTGLRDTPIATSGVFDDFGRPKWPAGEFLPFNDAAVLCLDVSRRRRWRFGGDRPERLDPYNRWAGENARWEIVLSPGSLEVPAGSQIHWRLVSPLGSLEAEQAEQISDSIPPGEPRQVGTITCRLPDVDQAVELCLEVNLRGEGLSVANSWPVWVYPPPPPPPAELAILDPGYLLDDWGEWLMPVPRLGAAHALSPYGLLLTTTWDASLERYLAGGGKALLLQQGNGPLPACRCPFWREAVKLFADHPLWAAFPQRGYADLQFFGMASDVAFDCNRLGDEQPGLSGLRPILRRLDARAYRVSEYLFEARLGRGLLLGCALRLQGGLGWQPFGWERNVAGSAMLSALLDYLSQVQP